MEYPLINTVLSALGDRLAALPLVEPEPPSKNRNQNHQRNRSD